MAQITVKISDFRIISPYSCKQEVYTVYNEDRTEALSQYSGTLTSTADVTTDYKTFYFTLPDGAEIRSAKVYAKIVSTTYGAQKLTVNGVSADVGSTVTADVIIANGATSVSVPFVFQTKTVAHDHFAAGTGYYTGESGWYNNVLKNTIRADHEGQASFESVYLLIEYADSYTPPEFVPYTDPNPVAGETYVKAVHMTELHENVNRLRIAKGLTAYAFTAITAMETSLAGWNAHVLEIRAALDEISTEHDAWLVLDVNRPRLDVLLQLRSTVEVLAA